LFELLGVHLPVADAITNSVACVTRRRSFATVTVQNVITTTAFDAVVSPSPGNHYP
jgi:hypothetical protein